MWNFQHFHSFFFQLLLPLSSFVVSSSLSFPFILVVVIFSDGSSFIFRLLHLRHSLYPQRQCCVTDAPLWCLQFTDMKGCCHMYIPCADVNTYMSKHRYTYAIIIGYINKFLISTRILFIHIKSKQFFMKNKNCI